MKNVFLFFKTWAVVHLGMFVAVLLLFPHLNVLVVCRHHPHLTTIIIITVIAIISDPELMYT